MRRSALLALLLVSLAHAGEPIEIPINDDCANAIPIAGDETVIGTTVNGTPDLGFPAFHTNGDDVGLEGDVQWYAYSPKGATLRVNATLCAPDNDGLFTGSTIYVYEDLCADGACEPCRYVAPVTHSGEEGIFPCPSTSQASAEFCARSGARYLIGVATDTPSEFTMRLQVIAPCDTLDATDSDQDCVPDHLDANPAVYDPCQDPAISFPEITLEQISFFYADAPTQAFSNHGRFGITIPNRGDDFTYLSLEIDGQPAIVNMPLWTTDFRSATTFETRTGFCPLPTTPGVALPDVEIRYCVTNVPVPGVPSVAPVQTVPIVQAERRFGGAAPDGLDVIAEAPASLGVQVFQDMRTSEIVFNINEDEDAITAQDLLDWAKRPGFGIIDLDEANERLACGPNSCANSLKWLNDKYCLEVDDIDNATDDELLDDLRERMGSRESDGYTSYGVGGRLSRDQKGFLNGKENFITDNEMPLRIGGQGATSPNPGQSVEIDNWVTNTGLLPSFRRGADIEVFTKWGGEDGTANGHWLNLVSIVGLQNEDGELCYHAIVADDRRQGVSDDDPADEDTVKLEMDGDTWTFSRGSGADNVYTICGYTTEEPTVRATMRAINKERMNFEAKLMGIDPANVSEADAQCLKEIAECFNHLSGALGSQIFNVPPGQFVPVDSVNLAGMLMLEGFDMAEKAQTLCDAASQQAGGRSIADPLCAPPLDDGLGTYLDALAAAFDGASSTFGALMDTFPPDADLDDIPDDVDPCPDRTNPNFIDCNGNGLNDVCELDPATNDLNDNSILDVCEFPNNCFYDTNGDGLVDIIDFGAFGSAFGSASGDTNYDPALDSNNDDVIDIIDFGLFGTEFGREDC